MAEQPDVEKQEHAGAEHRSPAPHGLGTSHFNKNISNRPELRANISIRWNRSQILGPKHKKKYRRRRCRTRTRSPSSRRARRRQSHRGWKDYPRLERSQRPGSALQLAHLVQMGSHRDSLLRLDLDRSARGKLWLGLIGYRQPVQHYEQAIRQYHLGDSIVEHGRSNMAAGLCAADGVKGAYAWVCSGLSVDRVAVYVHIAM